MINRDIFPWQLDTWRHLVERLAAGRLPHALLLAGPAGTGKRRLARAFAHSLLCEQRGNDGAPCGQCASCRLIAAGNHPDLHLVRPALVALAEGAAEVAEDASAEPDEGEGAGATGGKTRVSRDLTVEQVRALADALPIATHRGGLRVVVLYPAEAMNAVAANALLKTLEEPTPGVVFLLTSDAPHRLLPTIVSRCLRIDLPIPEATLVAQWLSEQGIDAAYLRLAGGAPVKAAALAQTDYRAVHARFVEALARGIDLDPISTARTLETEIKRQDKEAQLGTARSIDLLVVVHWLQRWLHDALRLRLAQSLGYHPEAEEDVRRLDRVPTQRLLAFQAWLVDAARQAGHPVNPQLFLEDCLLRYRALFERSAASASI